MRVLFISSFLLFAESRSGAAKRLYYFAKAIERECELSLICLDVGMEAASFRPEMKPCPRFLQVQHERRGLNKFRDPANVPNYLAPDMRQQIENFAAAAQFDVVFCAFPSALSLIGLPALRTAKNVVYLEDDLSFELFKERTKKAQRVVKKIHMAIRWLQAERFFQRLMPRVKAFVAISEEEADIVRRKFPHLVVKIVGYGIPMEEYPRLNPPTDRMVLGFIGNYVHQSNCDAMHFFLEKWYPILKAKHARAVMRVAGKGVPRELADAWSNDLSIEFHENVPELRGFYEGIAIFVNPIVSQRGLRTKLVEAAAFGRPIISTALGGEGLEDLDLRLSDTPEAFVQSFEDLQDAATFQAVSDRNRATTERVYSIEAIGRGLVDCLRENAGSSA